ncbi:MAG TPA: hypothetical protein VHF22_07505 [Planctomycetota bacterium]|nr:hypothetical protein [Planctomycetota bacterium]
MTQLAALIGDSGAKLDGISAYLDRLDPAARLADALALRKADQARLWSVAGPSAPAFGLDFLVPPDAPPLKPFPFEGKNTLPLFTRFRKVFYRTPDGQIGGYNDQSMSWLTGPGYYITHLAENAPGPVVVDYTMIPEAKPDGWPAIKRNEKGLSRLVYGFMHDYLRRVSRDVVIGRAYKHGKETENYFVLCRPA